MSRESLVLLFGILVVFLPLLGLPLVWKQWALVAVGVLLVMVGYSLRRSAYFRRIDRGNGERGTDSFVESSPQEALWNSSKHEEEEEVSERV